MASRESQLKHKITSDFGELFEENTKLTLFPKIFKNGRETTIQIPESDIYANKFIPLIENVGAITLEETVDQKGTILNYSYRFISNEYIFTTSRILSTEKKVLDNGSEIFSFHYDFFIDNKPHEPHVTVCHPTIRYISKQISIDEFFSFIKETFFCYEAGKLRARKDSIWLNRI